jgi:hypothetical protein
MYGRIRKPEVTISGIKMLNHKYPMVDLYRNNDIRHVSKHETNKNQRFFSEALKETACAKDL